MDRAFSAPSAAAWAGAFAAAALFASLAVMAAPLAAYVWLIALFGLPHVIAELRYVDGRFGQRIGMKPLAIFGALIAGLLLSRAGGQWFGLPWQTAAIAELSFGAGLALAASAMMARWRVAGFLVGLVIAIGAWAAPLATFLVWAWLHNLTPLGFAAEALRGRERTMALSLLAIPFLALPAFIALGGLGPLTVLVGLDPLAAGSALGAGPRPPGGFTPPGERLADILPFFQAAVVMQVMHYLAVIAFLPWLLARGGVSQARAPWPSWPVFTGLVVLAGLVSLAAHSLDYAGAKSAYALAAAFHSWVELPVLLLALGGALERFPTRKNRTMPVHGSGKTALYV
jgi:hypothetical protein